MIKHLLLTTLLLSACCRESPKQINRPERYERAIDIEIKYLDNTLDTIRFALGESYNGYDREDISRIFTINNKASGTFSVTKLDPCLQANYGLNNDILACYVKTFKILSIEKKSL